MQKSFIVHNDSLSVLDELTDEQCGELFRAIKAYQNDEEIELSSIVRVAFSPFKSQFKRDKEKYEKTCKARAEAGSRGGKQKVANARKSKQKVANVADSDSKSKSKSKSKNDSNTKTPSSASPPLKFEEGDLRLAEHMYSKILEVAPKARAPNLERWANDIRLMRTVDNQPLEEIASLFNWANRDPFWSTNILSPAKLRKQAATLDAKRRGESNGNFQRPDQQRSVVDRIRAGNERRSAEREAALSSQREIIDHP